MSPLNKHISEEWDMDYMYIVDSNTYMHLVYFHPRWSKECPHFTNKKIALVYWLKGYPRAISHRYYHPLTEACERSSVSKIRFILLLICIISPLIRHNFLLSSSTVFIDSIHRVSMGPSNTTHFRSSFWAEANSLYVCMCVCECVWECVCVCVCCAHIIVIVQKK